ncbi:MAG TPA: DeoR/GlpR family DNA-binding transcription regulator [Candidatus Paceibacterota bacterium]|nr:DeoR/GlpR family DNA-binding transcription regulator [Verrucomicrobiota bacterium]HSA10699.1 DeoR/GlpR family DNA-binding transcription regulator [Candidatus Paceibacterota bacterium]
MADSDQKALAPQRWDHLRALIRDSGVIRVEDLCRRLKVSPATVRRDLDQLERGGAIRRVHGGAVSVESRLDEPVFADKTSLAVREKRRIAEAALRFIEPGDTIYLDGGSTVLELARLLRDRTNLTVVTNSLYAAHELAGRGPRLIVIGGELRRLSQTMVGPLTGPVLHELHLDKAFMGTIGFALNEGLTTTDPSEAFTKRLVKDQARQVIVLADSSKAGKVSFASAGHWEKVHVLITDKQIDKDFAKELIKKNIKLVRA